MPAAISPIIKRLIIKLGLLGYDDDTIVALLEVSYRTIFRVRKAWREFGDISKRKIDTGKERKLNERQSDVSNVGILYIY
jgi:transposase